MKARKKLLAALLVLLLVFGGLAVTGYAAQPLDNLPRLQSFHLTIDPSEGETVLPGGVIITGQPILNHYSSPQRLANSTTVGEILIPVSAMPEEWLIAVNLPYESVPMLTNAPFVAVVDWGDDNTTGQVPQHIFHTLRGFMTGSPYMAFRLITPSLEAHAAVNILYNVKFIVAPDGFGERVELEALSDSEYEIRVASNLPNGRLETDHVTANVGDTITITVIPNEGFELTPNTLRWTTDFDASGDYINTPAGENRFSFEMPNHDVIVSAQFGTVTEDGTDSGTSSETSNRTLINDLWERAFGRRSSWGASSWRNYSGIHRGSFPVYWDRPESGYTGSGFPTYW